jgi:hypothetical protein
MWTDDYQTLATNYDSVLGTGAGYIKFKNDVKAKLGNAWVADPELIFDAAKAPSLQSSYVNIKVEFMMPGEVTPHQYVTSGVIGQNP